MRLVAITPENVNIDALYSNINPLIQPIIPENEEENRQSYLCSLIIPAYNEEKRIKPFLEELKSKLPLNWEVIIVCDGTDKTAEIARKVDDRFRVLSFDKRLGKGGATKKGFKVAIGEIIGYVDADGSIPWESVQKVFDVVIKGEMVATGSRWMKDSKVIISQPFLRIILGRMYHYFTILFLRVDIKDTQCGLKVFRREVVTRILKNVTISNLSFDTAFLYHTQKAGYRIAEIPITWKDTDGSKISPFKSAFVMFLTLVGIRFAHSKLSKKVLKYLEMNYKLFGYI